MAVAADTALEVRRHMLLLYMLVAPAAGQATRWLDVSDIKLQRDASEPQCSVFGRCSGLLLSNISARILP